MSKPALMAATRHLRSSAAHASTTMLVPGLADEVRTEQTRIALSAAGRNLAAGIAAMLVYVCGAAYASSGSPWTPRPAALGWGLSLMACMCVGIVLMRVPTLPTAPAAVVHRFGRRYIAFAACSAVVWGSTAWIILPAGPAEEALLIMLMAMVIAAGAGAQAVWQPLVITFTGVLTGVFASGLLRLGSSYHTVIGLAFVVYTGTVLMYARDQERAVARTIVLSLTNAALLTQVSSERQAALGAKAEAEAARGAAETSERAKTNFIAATSHDLRQPLHALVQYVAHLSDANENRELLPTIAKIGDSVAALQELLDAVLDFSKLALGSVQPQMATVRLAELLPRLDVQLRPAADAKMLVLAVEPSDERVCSDFALLERVLRNLAQNAIDHSAKGRVRIRARRRRDFVRILIADSGVGIPTSERKRIFEPYYQLDNPARDRRRGLGLGLTIVRELSMLLGLRVRLRSLVARGSTFAVDVPVVDETDSDADTPTPQPSADHVRGSCVLLIDDDRLALDAMATTLQDLGCRVLCAGSLDEAFRQLEEAEFPPQIIVSDYRLGRGGDGLRAIERLQRRHAELVDGMARLAAVMISGDTSAEEMARVHASGHRMLHKPVSPRSLRDALAAELASGFSGDSQNSVRVGQSPP